MLFAAHRISGHCPDELGVSIHSPWDRRSAFFAIAMGTNHYAPVLSDFEGAWTPTLCSDSVLTSYTTEPNVPPFNVLRADKIKSIAVDFTELF